MAEELTKDSNSDGANSQSSAVETPSDPIKEAQAAAEELRKQNEKLEKNIKEMKEIESRAILGGRSFAGSTAPKPETKEEKILKENKEFAKKAGGLLWDVYKNK